ATSNESGPAVGYVTNRAPLLQDIQVTKAVNSISNPCNVGTCQVTYLVTATNVGRNAEINIQVTDSLPSQLQYLSNVASQGSYVSGTGIWSIGNLSSGNSATLQITAKVTGFSASIQNCAGLTASTPTDTNPANNTGCVSITPTHVFLSGFRAYEDGGRMAIEWTTSSESGTAGFYLFRKDPATGSYLRMNRRMLPALLTSPLGGTYHLIDEGASPGAQYTYMLVEIENAGSKKVYGPFRVSAGGTTEIEKPGESGSVDPDSLFRADGDSSGTPEKISKVASAGGVIAYSNKRSPETVTRRGDTDMYSGYTKVSQTPNSGIPPLTSVKTSSVATTASYGTSIKISVSRDGLYYLPASAIAPLLGLPEQIVRGYISYNLFSLNNRGQGVAYTHDSTNAGIFFYGRGVKSIYTDNNVYWLSVGTGIPMVTIAGTGPGPVISDNTFTETVHAEENRIVVPVLFEDPEADYWFWDVIVGSDPVDGTKTFPVNANGRAESAEAALTINLQGFTDTRHHVIVSLNGAGNIIGSGTWDGSGPKSFTFDCQGYLNEGENSVYVRGVQDDENALWSIFYVNSVDLSYKRLYRAVDNTLACRGDGNSPVTISGFTGPDILLFDTSVALKPKSVAAKTISGTDGNYSVSFSPASPDATYLAVLKSAGLSASGIQPALRTTLKSRSNYADYVIITRRDLASAASTLIKYRQNQGLWPKVVALEDVMDEFNYGVYDPRAIKDFLSFAYHNWMKPPKYVVLAGNGTYDYKNNLGKGDNLVPALMASTPMGLYPSDNLFVEVDADRLPKMSIGRLPVMTSQELGNIVNKIMSYETTGGSLFVAATDINDDGGDFTGYSDTIAAMAPLRYSVAKIYLSQHPMEEARTMLMDRINKGAVYLNFIGHSGPGQLGKYGLLTKDDLNSMTNSNGLNVMTAMTCLMGQYGIPGYNSLSESLLLKAGGGSVAVWSPSGYSFNSMAGILDEEFFKAAFRSSKPRLGDVLLKAFSGYNIAGGQKFMIDIYNLQGDPALKLK
ncbi:MAG TPA: C25 family cysteine peptidase, partial [Thermodesulfovibrionales bacterium]|nr:C25 family cysteine peptidase [Thermodesulfovibrionales bacterium]